MDEPFSPLVRDPAPEWADTILQMAADSPAGAPAKAVAFQLALFELAAAVDEPGARQRAISLAERILTGPPAELGSQRPQARCEQVIYSAALAWASERSLPAEHRDLPGSEPDAWGLEILLCVARAWTHLADRHPDAALALIDTLRERQAEREPVWLAGRQAPVRARELICLYNHAACVKACATGDERRALRHAGAARAAGDLLGAGQRGLSLLASEVGALISLRTGMPAYPPAAGRI